MSGQEGRHINPNLPDSYNPAVNGQTFSAGPHNLSTTQKEQVIELAEASAGHIHGGSNIAGGQFGSGSLGGQHFTLYILGKQKADSALCHRATYFLQARQAIPQAWLTLSAQLADSVDTLASTSTPRTS